MSHSHDGHDHHHGSTDTNSRRLWLTLALVLVYMGAEVIGGIISGSLALIADAGHMLSDAAALALTLFAMRYARRPATPRRTFGSYRAEIIAALVNGATLVAVAVYIFVEAAERFQQPPEVQGGLMLAVATGGLVVNGAGLLILHTGRGDSLNMRGAWLHVLTDALGSLQAIVAGGLIWAYGWHWVDPAASVLIGLLVIYSSWSLITQSVAVLMEGAPGHIDVDAVRKALLEVPSVTHVHDLHVWTITSGFVALSAHITSPELVNHKAVLTASRGVLRERFGIQHTTIQVDLTPECEGVTDHMHQ
jgi:cobalt-zinc-cadmium efflux system protein